MNSIQAMIIEIGEHTQSIDTRPTSMGIPDLKIVRGKVPPHQLSAIYQPMIGFVVQGTKTLYIGQQTLQLRGPSYFIVPTHIPIRGTASSVLEDEPYISIGLHLRKPAVRALLQNVQGAKINRSKTTLARTEATADWCEPWLRLLRLSRHPRDISALAPLYEQEILYRTLTGPQEHTLRMFAAQDNTTSTIFRSVTHLHEHFAEPIEVATLAAQCAMSVTNFHRQFKHTTGLSPIQFQKQLRILAARDLLTLNDGSVESVAHTVGYQSPSQFSREYTRFMGNTPTRDTAKLKQAQSAGLIDSLI